MPGTGADWLLDALAVQGVDVMFGNPGSTELPLLEAFPGQNRVRFVLGLHESSVIGMADGYAQQGDRLAVANVHVQPGLANALSGILNAARARVPILVTVGQQVTGLLDGAPFLGGELVEMARPLAKAAWEVAHPDELPALTERAISTAMEHPRGPVVLSLPLDVQAAPAPAPLGPIVLRSPPAPPSASLDDAARWLAEARHPVVLAGDGVAHEHAEALLAALAERLGAPILGEPFAARPPLATDHNLWRGPLPGFAVEIAPRLAGHDVVLAVGMPVFRLFGSSPGSAIPPGASLVHLDVDPAEIGRVHAPAVGLAGSVALGLEGLLERLGTGGDVSHYVSDTRGGDGVSHYVSDTKAGDEVTGASSPEAFCRAIAGAIGPDDLVVDEALTAGRSLRAAIGRRAPGTWLAHRGSVLGWGLPAAVGAKLADPGRRVMCVHGDGSLLFGVHALWTAARERLGLAVVVADNGGYEILRAGMEGLTGRPEGGWPGLWIDGPALDLVAVVRGLGASAERVDDPNDLGDALAACWARAANGPAVLVVPVTGRTPAVGYPL